MPALTIASIDDGKAVAEALLSGAGITYSTDYIDSDGDGNPDEHYLYGDAGVFGKFYVRCSGTSIEFGYCSDITFYDVYDDYGNYIRREVTITGGAAAFSVGDSVVYGWLSGVFSVINGYVIVNWGGNVYLNNLHPAFYGSNPTTDDKIYFAVSAVVVGSDILVNVEGHDFYYCGLSDNTVVQIDSEYWFKPQRFPVLLKGDGSEGSLDSRAVEILPYETATVESMSAETVEALLVSGVPVKLTAEVKVV